MGTEQIKTDSALVCAGQKGDKEALRRLLEQNWSWLKGLVYSILNDSHDTDDALQNICIRVISKIGTLRRPECFRPWLAVLARREALTLRRRLSRRPKPLSPHYAEQLAYENNTVDQHHRQILEAVRLLPDKYSEIFLLKYANDITYAQIAEILDVPVTTVQIRLVRARRMVHNIILGKEITKIPRT